MKKMSSNEIRNTWLRFFKNKGHSVEEGASLIPNNDPTLLWVNAGVAALKKYFDGTIIPKNPRICNVQKAIRTNDIENVGHTARHHTFFEMLGNFSIGDYFRNEAISFAYELLFSEEYFGLDKDKLYITYHPTDKATYNKWLEVGVQADHLIPCEGNFWEIGEGPCGPDTEMFYDRGEKYDPNHLGIKLMEEEIENDRYIEIWNIVFSQFNSKPGVAREDYLELPHKNIDTGAGLERFACILQDAPTNYETDLFMPIIRRCEQLGSQKYEGEFQVSFKIIADHLRTCTFALADGASFSNEGRGYVLRRLLRRGVRHGKKIGIKGEFLAKLVDVVIDIMKDFYPYLVTKSDYIKELITIEERKFMQTLEGGEKKLDDLYNKKHAISGEDAFLLYDTYGFPFELTLEYANEKGIEINHDEFLNALNRQKELARGNRQKVASMGSQNANYMEFKKISKFVGYDTLTCKGKVIKIFDEDGLKVVCDQTPFYAEMGGQMGDVGKIFNDYFKGNVVDTQTMPNGQHLHYVEIVEGSLNEADEVILQVNEEIRKATQANHSATHLMHKALKEVLGNHVNQQGSMVNSHNIRFDFNHFQNITKDEILKIEQIVNEKIQKQLPIITRLTSLKQAKEEGVTALFNEKYGNEVRVVDMEYSKELCGGCHVKNTKEIQYFAITSIESKGSGIYRIEAVTGNDLIEKIKNSASALMEEYKQSKEKLENMFKKANLSEKIDEVVEIPSYELLLRYRQAIEGYKEKCKEIDKKLKDNKEKEALSNLSMEEKNIKIINGKKVLIKQTNYTDMNLVKVIADNLVNLYKDIFVMLVNVEDEKLFFVAKTTPEYVKEGVHCGKIVKEIAMMCLGNGGGRPDMAQAGGKNVKTFEEISKKIEELLS